ncbi:MAG: hypothetical protein Kow009_10200 [Spirochaetales bacterium]
MHPLKKGGQQKGQQKKAKKDGWSFPGAVARAGVRGPEAA